MHMVSTLCKTPLYLQKSVSTLSIFYLMWVNVYRSLSKHVLDMFGNSIMNYRGRGIIRPAKCPVVKVKLTFIGCSGSNCSVFYLCRATGAGTSNCRHLENASHSYCLYHIMSTLLTLHVLPCISWAQKINCSHYTFINFNPKQLQLHAPKTKFCHWLISIA